MSKPLSSFFIRVPLPPFCSIIPRPRMKICNIFKPFLTVSVDPNESTFPCTRIDSSHLEAPGAISYRIVGAPQITLDHNHVGLIVLHVQLVLWGYQRTHQPFHPVPHGSHWNPWISCGQREIRSIPKTIKYTSYFSDLSIIYCTTLSAFSMYRQQLQPC